MEDKEEEEREECCICLQEIMLENVKYNLGKKYEFYAKIPLGQRSKGETTVAIKKEIAHK